MEELQTLNKLLEMTEEAKRLALDDGSLERIATLISEIRRKVQQEYAKFGTQRWANSPNPTQYERCMIGIREEIGRGSKPVANTSSLAASFGRMLEEIDRTIKEIKAKRAAM